jgi:hypothetical protein
VLHQKIESIQDHLAKSPQNQGAARFTPQQEAYPHTTRCSYNSLPDHKSSVPSFIPFRNTPPLRNASLSRRELQYEP